MTIWQPDLSAHRGPRFRALADAIAEAVSDGTLAPGTRLPPQRELAYRLGVTVGTVTRGYSLAEQRGLLQGEVGRGTFVRPWQNLPSGLNPLIDRGDLVQLTINAPPCPVDHDVLRQAMTKLAAHSGELCELFAYAPRTGLAHHRAAAAAWVARNQLTVDPDQVILAGGAHQAVVMALLALTRPGEPILTEALIYSGLNYAAGRLGLKLIGVEIDEEGLVPAALEAACRQHGASTVLLSPTAHNPTTATMSEERRAAIAALARRHDLAIVEDDVYGRLPKDRDPPIAAFAPERTIYVTSASKTIAPGLRLGILAAPERYLARLIDVQYDLFLICPPMMAELFSQWILDGTADRLARRQREEAIARQNLAATILHGHSYRAKSYSYHVWLPLPRPWRPAGFVDALRRRGVVIDPASIFAVGPRPEPDAVRLSLSAARTRDRLAHALRILRETLETNPAPRRETI